MLIAGGIVLRVLGSDEMDPRIGPRTAMLVCGVCLFRACSVSRLYVARTNRSPCRYVFGKYKGLYEIGFWWINPFMGRKKILVRARNLNVEPIKVN